MCMPVPARSKSLSACAGTVRHLLRVLPTSVGDELPLSGTTDEVGCYRQEAPPAVLNDHNRRKNIWKVTFVSWAGSTE